MVYRHSQYPISFLCRMFIWRSLLKLPENHAAYSSLVDKGTHNAFVRLHEEYPIKSRKLLRVLQRLVTTSDFAIFLVPSPLKRIWGHALPLEHAQLQSSDTVSTATCATLCTLCYLQLLNLTISVQGNTNLSFLFFYFYIYFSVHMCVFSSYVRS